MAKNALGLIETVGLAAALEAADAAMKAANVKLIGYELTKGGGLVVIKLTGDVGAVKAAIEAGKMAGSKVNTVWAAHIIPRPHQQLAGILESKETVGIKNAVEPAVPLQIQVTIEAELSENMVEEIPIEVSELLPKEQAGVPSNEEVVPVVKEAESAFVGIDGEMLSCDEAVPDLQQSKKSICNLCGDPACPRIKGDAKVTCIHYDKNTKEAE